MHWYVLDLYDALVAPRLKTALLVETWQHGKQTVVLPNNCSIEYKARPPLAVTTKFVFNLLQSLAKLFNLLKSRVKLVLAVTSETYFQPLAVTRNTCFHPLAVTSETCFQPLAVTSNTCFQPLAVTSETCFQSSAVSNKTYFQSLVVPSTCFQLLAVRICFR